MFYNVKKNSVSNYPNQTINCCVECFLKEEDKTDENKAVYYIIFQIPLQTCIGLTPEQIDLKIKEEGEKLFNAPEMKVIFESIELGHSIVAPEIIGQKKIEEVKKEEPKAKADEIKNDENKPVENK